MAEQAPVISEVFPLIWTFDVAALADWAITSLGLVESWRAPNAAGVIEHAELIWPGGRISINIKADAYAQTGPAGIALRVDDRKRVEAVYKLAKAAGANISQDLAESPVAYSFTALDPVGNQWWINAETGFLDQLRNS